MKTSKKIEVSCAWCSSSFTVYTSEIKRGRGVYCSKECARQSYMKGRESVCHYCNKDFYVSPSKIKAGGGIYCSVKCRANSKQPRVEVICELCHSPFMSRTSDLKKDNGTYCSSQCRDVATRIERICKFCQKTFSARLWVVTSGGGLFCSQWCCAQSKRISVERACEFCHIKFETSPSRVKLGRGRFCSKECGDRFRLGKSIGEKSPNWIGGSDSGKTTYGYAWRKKTRKVRLRDNYTCQECGKTELELGHTLSVHHKIPRNNFKDVRVADRITNLTSVCLSCHPSIEWSVPVKQLVFFGKLSTT